MDKQKRRKPNEDELRAAERIKLEWLKKKKKTGMTQGAAAGLLGWSQSLFGMYINGHMPLTIEPVLKLAKLLGQPATVLAPEITGEFANDINRLHAHRVIDEQAEVINGLEYRLSSAGVDSIADPAAPYRVDPLKEIASLLAQLPNSETQLLLMQLRQRVSMATSDGGVRVEGLAATDPTIHEPQAAKPTTLKRPS